MRSNLIKRMFEEKVKQRNKFKISKMQTKCSKAKFPDRLDQVEDRIEYQVSKIRWRKWNTQLKENTNYKTIQEQNTLNIQDIIERVNLQVIDTQGRKETQAKGPNNIFNKIIEKALKIEDRDGH